jgi:cyclophilin family peptidyl-prolyl cis-trans isomerase/HEAT repeat protein
LKTRFLVLIVLALLAEAGCMSTPPPKLPDAPTVPERQKMAWILQLEDQRVLRIDLPAPPPPPPPVKGKKPPPVVVPPPPSSSPDLGVLVKDAEPRIRRRAALAIGRVKDRAGIPLLVPVLADADPDVRAMAAFGLGLIGDVSAEPSLTPLLTDPAPLVRGRAAEALGLAGAKGAAAAIGQMVGAYGKHPSVTALQPDDESRPAAPEAEAFKLGLFALVRLSAYDAIAAAVLNGSEPATEWWPVAYALQRVEDPRAATALLRMLQAKGRYSRAFAARGLGRLKHAPAAKPLLALLEPGAKAGLEITVSAIRALAQVGATDAVAVLARLASDPRTDANVRLEAVSALGALHSPEGLATAQDLMTDEWPALRAAAFHAAAAIDPEAFVSVLAGLEPDQHWRVRSALADVLSALPADLVLGRLRSMLNDGDKRVIPAVLSSLTRMKVPDLGEIATERLSDPDVGVRAAAATALGASKADGSADALRRAYKAAISDPSYDVRTAVLQALVAQGSAEATPTLREALADKEWAVRVRAQELVAKLDPLADTPAITPVPNAPVARYDDPGLVDPTLSPHVFVETEYGTIEFQLAVLDAPQTSRNFVELVKKGYFNGAEVHRVVANFVVQDGDPRGDGSGGPGHTIRDELNDRPYLRGTVGMALEWRDTGGSQFFITHSPQPHLDARYTAFGHVVNGLEVLDRIRPGDRIVRIRVWDGAKWQN